MALDCRRVDTDDHRPKFLEGDISSRTVEDGFKALLAVEAYLKAGGGPQLAALCGAFYTYALSLIASLIAIDCH